MKWREKKKKGRGRERERGKSVGREKRVEGGRREREGKTDRYRERTRLEFGRIYQVSTRIRGLSF